MFSKACQYAIKVMIFIAVNQQEGKRTGLREIIDSLESPEAFTAKILQQLVRGGLLESYRGPTGGFVLPKNKQIRIYDVVATIDGKQLMEKCVLGLEECSGENPCPVHHRFLSVRQHLTETLLSVDIDDETLLVESRKLEK